ncbi:MAG TPA: hypothetical protein VGR62_18035 [Candidatus Binatia bacterium]|jgi:hypothetical protein|nr:hypothetical protein [Candidatus Binatia bacterium]
MEFVSWVFERVRDEWKQVKEVPTVLAVAVIMGLLGGWFGAGLFYAERFETQKERLEFKEDKIERLTKDIEAGCSKQAGRAGAQEPAGFGDGGFGGGGEPSRLPLPSSYERTAEKVTPRAKIAPCEEPIEVTPEQILREHNQIRHAYNDPFPGDGVSWKYKDQCIRWPLRLHTMLHGGDGTEIMTFAVDQTSAVIGAQVLGSDYPKLRLGTYGNLMAETFEVVARIEDVHECRIFLKDVVLSEVPHS